MKFYRLILLCFFSLSTYLEAHLNLDTLSQPFILETKQLHIPGYATAFNPCLVRWQERLLLCFRIRDPQTLSTNEMGLVWLDDSLNLVSDPVVLEKRFVNTTCPYHMAQDPRLIVVGDDLYIVFNNMIDVRWDGREIRRMFLARVQYEGNHFYIVDPECLDTFDGAGSQPQEKNWVPFTYDNVLFLSHSLCPHKVLKPIYDGSGNCELMTVTPTCSTWTWGELRGGTPAIRVGDEYLAFFHSSLTLKSLQSDGKSMQHYVMGAYMFSAEPPFSVTRMSSEPLVHPSFYNGPTHATWKPLRVVFPAGLVIQDDTILVSYGRQDHEIWVATLDKKALLESLVPTVP